MLDDLRHSIHIFRKSPGFAAASAGTLAVAIGATLAIFCVVYGILLRPLPVAHESRLAIVYGVYKALGRSTQPVPLVRYIEWRDHSRSVESIAAIMRGTLDLLGERGAERIQAQYVTANLFETLGVAPARGRAFRAGEPGECVVSYALWQRRLGGDPQIIGTWLRTARHACIIVGIMPEGFEHWRETADVWLPLEAQADFQKTRDSAGYSLYRGIARLKPGVTPEAAQLELAPLISDVERKRVTPAGVNVVALRDDVVAVGTRRALTFLGVLGVLVWIIACANVGALLLSRTTGRSPELAIRLALGATRWRILRLTAAESVVTATTGTAAGTFVGLLTLRLLLAFGPPAFARPDLIRMDSTALLAGVALAALTRSSLAL
jgi:putative ABC transport system permease protein